MNKWHFFKFTKKHWLNDVRASFTLQLEALSPAPGVVRCISHITCSCSYLAIESFMNDDVRWLDVQFRIQPGVLRVHDAVIRPQMLSDEYSPRWRTSAVDGVGGLVDHACAVLVTECAWPITLHKQITSARSINRLTQINEERRLRIRKAGNKRQDVLTLTLHTQL